MFSGTADAEMDSGLGLHLIWCPEVSHFLDEIEAQAVLGRLRSRALALELARLYPAATPSLVERRLVDERLIPELAAPSRVLERMVRRGMPRVPMTAPSSGASDESKSPMDVLVESLHPGFRHRYEPVIRLHESFVAVLDDPIWRLLNPRQVSAGRLANFAADAIAAGAPPLLVLPTENQLSEPECYDLLLRLALTPRFGRPLALRCALIRLRSGGLNGDLVAYESCLRAILDIVSTRASEDVVFESLTGIPCHGGRSGKVSPWLLADRQEGKIMNLADYMVATFSRVELSSLAASHGGEFEQYYRERGLDLGGLPRFAWRGSPPPTSFVSPMRLGLRSRRRGT